MPNRYTEKSNDSSTCVFTDERRHHLGTSGKKFLGEIVVVFLRLCDFQFEEFAMKIGDLLDIATMKFANTIHGTPQPRQAVFG
jgi:hypothetical protein